MDFIDRLIETLNRGDCVRAFPNMHPVSALGTDMLFSVDYNESFHNGTERWSISFRRDFFLGLTYSFEVKRGTGRHDYDIPVPKDKKKALLKAYDAAIQIEADRYNQKVKELSQ